MSREQRRRQRTPRPRRKGRIRRGVVIGSIAVAAVGSLALANVNTMTWFGLDGDADASAPATNVLSAEGETVAEQVVVQLTRDSKPSGWKAGKVNAGVNDPYSLACLSDRVAWSTARTRALTSDAGEGAVTVLAYPAGAGAAAYAEVSAAATACSDEVVENGLGVEGLGYRKGAAAVQVLRRGDVVAVVAASPADRMPDEKWLTELDDRAAALLADRCLEPVGQADDVHRNPWVDPEQFVGNLTSVVVGVPDVKVTTAEEVTSDPVVPLDAIPPVLPEEPVRPEPLVPEAVDLPELPLEVERPVPPVAPVEPDREGRADRAIADPEGPGCGWEFTGESAPGFDASEAEERHLAAVKKERQRLVDAVVGFERGKVAYYRAWAEHEAAALTYQAYADEMTVAAAEWQVVTDARAEFVAEFEKYRISKQAYDDFILAQQTAREEWDAAVQDCLEAGGAFEGQSPTACPPPTPAILSQSAPSVLPVPVPSVLAQLPEGWEPPAPVVEPEPEPEPEPDAAGDQSGDRGGDRGGDGSGNRGDGREREPGDRRERDNE